MTKNLRFFEEAAKEIEHERGWYHESSHAAESAFLRELERAVGAIVAAPERWPCYMAGTRRYVLPFPLSLVYFVEGDTIFVVSGQ